MDKTSDAVGVRFWFVAAGLITGMMGVAGFLMPKVLYLEDQHSAAAVDGETASIQAVTVPDLNDSR